MVLKNPSTGAIKLLYDGKCPLCLREVRFLAKKDAGRGLVEFVDIANDNYSPQDNAGIDFETAMGRIHAILPDGTVIRNVEVFRRIYDALGIGWIYSFTKIPVIGQIVDRLYEIWADLRLKLTGREDLKNIVAERQKRLQIQQMQLDECESRCQLDVS